jgi:hypothetical protein
MSGKEETWSSYIRMSLSFLEGKFSLVSWLRSKVFTFAHSGFRTNCLKEVGFVRQSCEGDICENEDSFYVSASDTLTRAPDVRVAGSTVLPPFLVKDQL